ncbi:MAG: hypothetical protein QNJ32_30850 [Xenococcaceae cyanobacterium MO_167.B27]|nr:hypothetical protein [Xenococcaceae cyanobacterium MO_167.B27]
MKRSQFLLTTAMATGFPFATSSTKQTYTDVVAQNSIPSSITSSFFVEHDGARIYVEREGTGTPVLLHGGLGHMGWFSEMRSRQRLGEAEIAPVSKISGRSYRYSWLWSFSNGF